MDMKMSLRPELRTFRWKTACLAIVVRAGLVVHGLVGVDLRDGGSECVPLWFGISWGQILLGHN